LWGIFCGRGGSLTCSHQFWSTFSQQTVIDISVFNSFSLFLILLPKIAKLFENILNINFTQYHSFYPELTTIRTENPRVAWTQ
jgi:hypothetical protein